MQVWLVELDRVLRGDATRPDALRAGAPEVSAGRLAATGGLLAAFYGLCMGFFGLFNRPEPEYRLLLNGMLKVPALFGLTLVVTFPSLYVFNALVGSRLTVGGLARLMTAALTVTLAVLASFGPIVAFFAVTTTSYPFMLLLNVAVFGLAGLLGMGFLLQTLHRLSDVIESLAEPPPPVPPGDAPVADVPAVWPAARGGDMRVKTVFVCWVVVFAVVGAQMSWVLRPFVGTPDGPFTWFRAREASFFEAVANALRRLLS
jgi:hypothetical protein